MAASANEPFPLLNVDGDAAGQRGSTTGAQANGSAVRRRKQSDGAASGSADAKKESKHVSRRRKERTLFGRAKQYAVRHSFVLPLMLMLLIVAAYAVYPSDANPVSHFIFLSYKLPIPADAAPGTPAQYGKGLWDIAFVVFYTIVLSFTREFIMQELLRPLARYAGLRSRTKQARFMEQMYTAVYFGVLGPAGVFVMSRTPVWFFNTRGMYENSPHHTHEAYFKFYYLLEAAYWAQQAIVLVLGMEKPRKDFKELVGHHIVSLALIGLSYRFHFTYIGLAVYITHDISDFFLACSKSLNYVDGPFMGPFYGLFMCIWIYCRHYLNLRIIYSLFTEFKTIGPYQLDWSAEQFKCPLAFVITTSLLSSLQALNLFWLFFIIRIAYRFVVHNVAKDDRSDGEEESDLDADADADDNDSSAKDAAAPSASASAPAPALESEKVPVSSAGPIGSAVAVNGKPKRNGVAVR